MSGHTWGRAKPGCFSKVLQLMATTAAVIWLYKTKTNKA